MLLNFKKLIVTLGNFMEYEFRNGNIFSTSTVCFDDMDVCVLPDINWPYSHLEAHSCTVQACIFALCIFVCSYICTYLLGHKASNVSTHRS